LGEILKQITNTEIRRKKMKKKLSEEAKPKTKKVRFNLYAPGAERVFLAGDFNHWDVHNLPMKKDKKGTWEASFALPTGRYEYRFWVDEVWLDDPNAQERVENPFGSQNCVRMMS
jgi:1,4-alpha-glucan branching enzyme